MLDGDGLLEPAGVAGDLSVGAAIVLGVVEGLTEWLPVSSTGHLAVTQDLLGIEGRAAASYAIAIQAGAILAVVVLYRARLVAMLQGALGRDLAGRRALVATLIAAAPAAVLGLTLEDVIKDRLFGPWPVVLAWLVGGVVIVAYERGRRAEEHSTGNDIDGLGLRSAVAIGLAQSFALWPGVSRSLVTVIAGTAVGLRRTAAVEFSFVLGFITLGGATLYEAASGGRQIIAAFGVASPLLGFVVAFVVALAAMRWMVAYLTRRGLAIFGWYRIGIAVVVGGVYLTGTL